MQVYVDRSGEISLLEDQDFTALKLVTDLSHQQVLDAFDRQGHAALPYDSTHIWIPQSWFLEQNAADDQAWRWNFEKMMAYASEKGWIHPDVAAIRVHVSCRVI